MRLTYRIQEKNRGRWFLLSGTKALKYGKPPQYMLKLNRELHVERIIMKNVLASEMEAIGAEFLNFQNHEYLQFYFTIMVHLQT